MNITVMGVDPGIARTGFGVITEDEQGNIKAIDFGVISTDQNLSDDQRLLHIHNALQRIIEIYQPTSAAIEKLFFQKNVRTAFSVCQSRGVALLTFAKAAIPIAEYTPLEIKQAITSYGKAEKRQMQLMVQTLLNLNTYPNLMMLLMP
jgi:crossover junction endodeoxyribonuclease RuvC